MAVGKHVTRTGLYVFKRRVNYHGGDKKRQFTDFCLPNPSLCSLGRNGWKRGVSGPVFLQMRVDSVQMIHLYNFVWYFPFLFFLLLKVIAHWVQIFRTLKNKYDLTLCPSRLHTASETFVCHKKIRIRFDFLRFRIRNKHFDRKGWRIRKNAYENFGPGVQGPLLSYCMS